MLHIFVPPFSQRSGNDVIGERTASALTQCGLPSLSHDLWPDNIAGAFMSGKFPFGRRIFRSAIASFYSQRAFSKIASGDDFWVLGAAVPAAEAPNLERNIKRAVGGRYIFHVMDDWFNTPFLRDGTIARVQLADLVVVPTPELVSRVIDIVPNAKVVRLEEPIDVERVHPLPSPDLSSDPLVVWCGNPGQFARLAMVAKVLNRVRKEVPFRFRVISGNRPTLPLEFEFDWEWRPYDYSNESNLLAGAVAGLSPLDDTPYTRCKGAYKIKTYLAAGIPAIASPVGYQRELVHDGITGFLPESEEAWKEALKELITNPDRATKMGAASREVAVCKYSHTAVMPSWVQAIKSVSSASPELEKGK